MQRRNAKNIQSPDLHQTKVTPRTRPVHEAAHAGQLKNADPSKHYVLVPMLDNIDQNHEYYVNAGYKIEIAEKDGVRIHMGSPAKIGEPLRMRELVLVSCSKERSDEIFQVGINGMTGQKYFDTLMSRIRRNPTEKRNNEIIPGLREQYDISDPDGGIEDNTFR